MRVGEVGEVVGNQGRVSRRSEGRGTTGREEKKGIEEVWGNVGKAKRVEKN